MLNKDMKGLNKDMKGLKVFMIKELEKRKKMTCL